jgi:hypothetical protein
MNAALIDLIRHHAAPAVNAVGGAVGNIASPANQQYALKRGIGSMLKHPALPLAAAGLLLPMAALEFDRSAINDQNAAKWNAQQEMGRGSEMGDFSKNSALRKMAVEVATTKIAGFMDSARAFGRGAQSAFSERGGAELGKSMVQGGAKALGAGVAGGGMALAAKGIMSLVDHLTQPSATTILKHLMQDDPIISRADPKRVIEAYATFKRFAPVLSTDLNATRSYLREALTMGGGVDFSTIANLAKAEKSVGGGGGGKGDK